MELYYRKVKETEINDEIHVIPAGLKYGVQLLYADFMGNESLFKKYFAEMNQARLKYINVSGKSVCSFEFSVLESLIFTNRTKEMKFLIEKNTDQINNDEGFIPAKRKRTHDEVWKILCASAYQKMGAKENTEKVLNRVNLENLEIGWTKYYSIMFYFVQLNGSENNQHRDVISKLKKLIDETYFSYYYALLNDCVEFSEENKQFKEVRKHQLFIVAKKMV